MNGRERRKKQTDIVPIRRIEKETSDSRAEGDGIACNKKDVFFSVIDDL